MNAHKKKSDQGMKRKLSKSENFMLGNLKVELTDDLIEDYKESFNKLDKHKTGEITFKDAKNLLKNYNISNSDNEIEKVFETENIPVGNVDWNMFLKVLKKCYENYTIYDALITAFENFDKKKSGKISTEEFKFILSSLGTKLDESTVEEIFNETGLDSKNEFNYKDFIKKWIL